MEKVRQTEAKRTGKKENGTEMEADTLKDPASICAAAIGRSGLTDE